MRISQISFSNFRCFGSTPVTIALENFNALIGPNGAGKTAVLQALLRLFGIRTGDRSLTRSDFHVPSSAGPDSIQTIPLWIEARLEFPSLATDANDPAIPECFRQMIVDNPGAVPFCRVRLEATWTRTAQAEGEIDEKLCWITNTATELTDSMKRRMTNLERSHVQVTYVPASRDPSSHLRQAAGALLHPLLKAIRWSPATKTAANAGATGIRNAVQSELGMQKLQEAVGKEWKKLQDFAPLSEVKFQPLNPEFEALLRYMEAVFLPTGGTNPQSIDRLSDGLRSLFYFSLLGARFDLERTVTPPGATPPFDFDATKLPTLSVFAIEEPENHLAPHYLTRILSMLQRISKHDGAQVVLSSHSPGILSRVEPDTIRHIRYDTSTGQIRIKALTLPSKTEDLGEAYKYVKEAVKAHPELYFSTGVVLGEGDSELVVLPRLANARDQSLDERFISIVPLGGRHVNHFWRLLRDLEIPHVTLLDLDRERHGGGWGRIHYAVTQLQKYSPRFTPESMKLTQADIDRMPTFDWSDPSAVQSWIDTLEIHGVFFSAPLDIDFLMLRAFPSEYKAATDGGTGPRIPTDSVKYQDRLDQARNAVLKPEGGDGTTYTADEKADFIWYHYLFLGRGKPSTHIRALASVSPADLQAKTPPVISRLFTKILLPRPPQPPRRPPPPPRAA